MKLIVNPHTIEIVKDLVNEKEIDITKCEFEFADEITDDYVKEAYFTYNGTTYKQIIQNNECKIPYEVLENKGMVEIGVVAYKLENDEYVKRYNPSPAYFNSLIGSLKGQYENSEPITPTDKEQIEQALNDGLNDIQNAINEVDDKIIEVNDAIEETNNLNIDVNKVDKEATIELTKKDGTQKEVKIYDGVSLQFMWQGTSLGIKTDDMQDYVFVNLQGVQGIPGPQGEPFRIKKTYSSVAEMNADFNNMNYGDYVMIASTVEEEDNAKLYTRGELQWIFITDFSGATGIKGETGATPNIQIGNVTSGDTPNVTRTGTNENPILNFTLVKGDKGNKGDKGDVGLTGNGISSVRKTSTSGLVDTYTITFTNGTTTTFDITNGEDGEVTQEQLDKVQAELDYYKMLENALPKVEGEGESITLEDTAKTPMHLNFKGQIQQVSTSISGGDEYDSPSPDHPQDIHIVSGDNEITIQNKNYLHFNDNSTTSYGVTTTILNNDITISGTNTNMPAHPLLGQTNNFPKLQKGETYIFSSTKPHSGTYIQINYKDTNNKEKALVTLWETSTTFVVPNDFKAYSWLFIGISANVTTINLNFKLQIEKGTTATDYVEHQEYTKEINLPVENLANVSIIGQVPSLSNGQLVSLSGSACTDYIEIDNAKDYTFSFSLNNTTIPYITFYGENDNYLGYSQINSSGYTLSTSTYYTNTRKIRIRLDQYERYNYLQLEPGTKANSYTPYGTTPIEVGGIGDYEDEFFKNTIDSEYYDSTLEQDKWYLKKRIGKYVYNDDLATNSSTSKSYHFITPVLNIATNLSQTQLGNRSYCNMLPTAGTDTGLYGTTGTSKIRVNISKDIVSSFREGMDLFASKNLTIYYPLATPENILLNDTLQETLDSFYSWQEQTNISQENNDLPFVIKASAIRDMTKIYDI